MDSKETLKKTTGKICNSEQSHDDESTSWPDISHATKMELDRRLQHLKEDNCELYTWDEVKKHLQSLR